ncbi:unnamed protein product [Prunus armeniaca]
MVVVMSTLIATVGLLVVVMSTLVAIAEGRLLTILPFWVLGTLVIWGGSRTLRWGWGRYRSRWRITRGAAFHAWN